MTHGIFSGSGEIGEEINTNFDPRFFSASTKNYSFSETRLFFVGFRFSHLMHDFWTNGLVEFQHERSCESALKMVRFLVRPNDPAKRYLAVEYGSIVSHPSLDWFKGKSTGNHGFYHKI